MVTVASALYFFLGLLLSISPNSSGTLNSADWILANEKVDFIAIKLMDGIHVSIIASQMKILFIHAIFEAWAEVDHLASQAAWWWNWFSWDCLLYHTDMRIWHRINVQHRFQISVEHCRTRTWNFKKKEMPNKCVTMISEQDNLIHEMQSLIRHCLFRSCSSAAFSHF